MLYMCIVKMLSKFYIESHRLIIDKFTLLPLLIHKQKYKYLTVQMYGIFNIYILVASTQLKMCGRTAIGWECRLGKVTSLPYYRLNFKENKTKNTLAKNYLESEKYFVWVKISKSNRNETTIFPFLSKGFYIY